MKSTEQHNQEFEPVRRLLDVRLKARMSAAADAANHPDDDVINAFVEGRLDDSESRSLVSHLITCRSCLHLTAQLIRLQPDTEDAGETIAPEAERGPLQRFFDRLSIGAMPPADEDVVFAYQDNGETKSEEENKAESGAPDED